MNAYPKIAFAIVMLIGLSACGNAPTATAVVHIGQPQQQCCEPVAQPVAPAPVVQYAPPPEPVAYAPRSGVRRIEPVRPVQSVVRVQPAPCVDGCNIDMRAQFIDCVIRDGKTMWRYRTERGIYAMTAQQRSANDLLRIRPNGSVIGWVARG